MSQGNPQVGFSQVVRSSFGSANALQNGKNTRGKPGPSSHGYTSQPTLLPNQGYLTGREYAAAIKSGENKRMLFGQGGIASKVLPATTVAQLAAFGNHQRAKGLIPYGWGCVRNSTKKLRKSRKSRKNSKKRKNRR